jgi:hypothetical protein
MLTRGAQEDHPSIPPLAQTMLGLVRMLRNPPGREYLRNA